MKHLIFFIIRLLENNDYICTTSYEDCISIWFVTSQLQFDKFYTFPSDNEDLSLKRVSVIVFNWTKLSALKMKRASFS